ncbi:hypothetical protein [Salinibaculum rarum]|uniref:hypothetical protein n=1 Tax=Salinibaculum rarum TaxID=3058903 RepID=UPI00265E6DE7|nr:hypothetical protein [Salinibaculum sp. KK48]
MSRRRSSRSVRRADDADVTYEIPTHFGGNNSKILLIAQDENEVEVIAGNLPIPKKHDRDRNYPETLDDPEKRETHAVAQWIVTDAKEILSRWEPNTSSSKTNNPNYNLRDIYFTCQEEEVDEAVMAVKELILQLEKKRWKHAEQYDSSISPKPSEDLQ